MNRLRMPDAEGFANFAVPAGNAAPALDEGRFQSAETMARSWLSSLDVHRIMRDPTVSCRIPVAERFDWHGRPLDPGFNRTRVLARQVYVLSHTALSRNPASLKPASLDEGARDLAAAAAAALIRQGIDADGQFVCRMAPDGSTIDATHDLYDIAFGLFALAWWYRLSADPAIIGLAKRSVERVRETMRSPSGQGYVARCGEVPEHQQNAHMHLFEAAIFLHAFTGADLFRDLADELYHLATSAFLDRETGTLPEFFDQQWRPLATGGSVRIEPGHLYEWVWLLNRYALMSGNEEAFDIADDLFGFAQAHGHCPATGLIFDAVDPAGCPLSTDFRIWPNTEFLKAQVAMQERYGSGPGFDDECVRRNVARIREHFLTRRETGSASALGKGWWIDSLHGATLQPKCDHIPASTLYHIYFAFTELLRSRSRRPALGGMPW